MATLLSMVVALLTTATYSSASDPTGILIPGSNVDIFEFLGHNPRPRTPTSDVADTVATVTAAGRSDGHVDTGSTEVEEKIVKNIGALLKQLEKLYMNVHEAPPKSNYSEEGSMMVSTMKNPYLNNVLSDVNPITTFNTLKDQAYTPMPVTNGKRSPQLTTEVLPDTEVQMVTQPIKDTQPESAVPSPKHKNQMNPKVGSETIMLKAQRKSQTHTIEHKGIADDAYLVENVNPDTRSLQVKASNSSKPRNVGPLIKNTTDVETSDAGVNQFPKEYNVEKPKSDLEVEILTNNEENLQTSHTEMPLYNDDVLEITKSYSINGTFHKEQNVHNETERQMLTVEVLRNVGHSDEQNVQTPQGEREDTSDVEALSLPDTKPPGLDTLNIPAHNADEASALREMPVFNYTTPAVKELFPILNKLESLAIVVERSEVTLQQAAAIIQGAIGDETALDRQLLLVTYADEVSATPCSRADLRGLVERLPASDGPRWSTHQAVLEAAQRTRAGGGVLLVAASPPTDQRLAYTATRALRVKRLKLDVVWCGPRSKGDEGSLRDLSWYSGGEFLVSDHTTVGKQPQQLVTLVMQRGLYGSSEVAIPVDSSLQSVDITVQGPVTTAVLYDPTGRPTKLQPLDNATPSNDSLLAARLNTTGATLGRWTLAVVGAGASRYDVTARAPSPIGFATKIETVEGGSTLNLRLRGKVDVVQGVTALDRLGREVARLNYTRKTPVELAVADNQLPSAASYLLMSGSDSNGVNFQRVSYLPQQTTAGTASPIELEVAPNSTLSALPGQTAQIIYTVTNNQEMTSYIDFRCSSQHFSTSVQPQRFQLAAHQTVYVLVTVNVPQNTPQNTQDVITMSAIYGPNNGISKTAYFRVGNEVRDNEKPTISYSVDSDCGSSDTTDCQLKMWRVELVLQDKQSGLLQVTSQPKGLRLRSTFVVGTKDLVGAYYSATCCDPSMEVTVIDTRSNYTKQTITATSTGQLSTAATAGIVVGVVLFIIIIIIAAVIVARRRRQKSVSFPQATEN